MSINPIDVMRSQEASNIKHIENQRYQHAQEQVGKSFQETKLHEQQKPTDTEKSDNNEYRYDAKKKGNNEYKGSSKKKNNNGKEENKKSNKPQNTGGGIDILI